MDTELIERMENRIVERDLELIEKIEKFNDSTNGKNGYIRDSDTILKDLVDECDFEFSGISQDIFCIYKRSHDKAAVRQMFFEFTGVDFEEYLEKCVKESSIYEKNSK